MAMNDCAISVISGVKSSIVTPLAEENTCGIRDASWMSSYLVRDQKPWTFSSGGSRSDSGGLLQATGFSARRIAKARSRSSRLLRQNDRALRSMSLCVAASGPCAMPIELAPPVIERCSPAGRRGAWPVGAAAQRPAAIRSSRSLSRSSRSYWG